MTNYRITIRNVDYEVAEWFRDLAHELGVSLGEAFEMAVEALADLIEEDNNIEDCDVVALFQQFKPS